MNRHARRHFITLFVISALAAVDLLAQSARENAADAEWLIKVLEKELRAAGFDIVSSDEKNRAVTLVARRPLT